MNEKNEIKTLSSCERYKCVKCKEFLRVPVQLNCGCRVCLHCFNIIKESDYKRCPNTDEECLKCNFESHQVVLRDKSIENEMKTIKIQCPNDNCDEIVFLNQFSDHFHECKLEIDTPQTSCQQINEIVWFVGQIELLGNFYNKRNKNITSEEKNNIDKTIENVNNSVAKLKETFNNISRFTITLEKSVFIWPIYNFEEVYKNSVRKDPAYVMSDKFYINDFGYKLVIKLFPNGDGAGLNTHLSMYFAVIKGKYDPLLDWPFRERISLELIGNKNKDYSETFRGAPDSHWAQKPKTEMNTAVGNPTFITIDRVRNSKEFLINGTLFVKAKVHYY